MGTILRTPDERFEGLSDYPFAPNYATIKDPDLGDLRMHHVDEGPRDGPVVLLIHGEPSWSYLYRKMIPILAAAGLRAVAPDMIGFGRSDKPEGRDVYTYNGHVAWMQAWLEEVGLSDITLFGQDWGGLIGLRLVAADPDRFARVMIGNTALPTGDQYLGDAFIAWRDYSQSTPTFDAGRIVQGATVRALSDAEIDAYNAPFPDDTYQAGARQFPMLVPATPADPAAEQQWAAWDALKKFDKPFLTCFSDQDMVMRGGEEVFKNVVPGAAGQDHFITKNAGHFLQEDAGPILAEKLVAFVKAG